MVKLKSGTRMAPDPRPLQGNLGRRRSVQKESDREGVCFATLAACHGHFRLVETFFSPLHAMRQLRVLPAIEPMPIVSLLNQWRRATVQRPQASPQHSVSVSCDIRSGHAPPHPNVADSLGVEGPRIFQGDTNLLTP